MDLGTNCVLIVLGLLPFACLFLTFIALSNWSQNNFAGLIKSSLIWGSSIAIMTNVLSFFSVLNIKFVFIYWVLYAIILIVIIRKHNINIKIDFNITIYNIILALIVCVTLFVAIIYPPNNWDSMTYHLPKIMHWAQNENISHYITGNTRQNFLAPFAEMIILQSYILSKSDYYMNLVQWFSFVGILFVVIDTASQLGAGKRGEVASALFVATVPIIIAEATSTQTDNVVAFFLCCSINRLFVWQNAQTAQNASYFAVALGLAILTKGTAYLLALPLVCVVAFYGVIRFKKLFFQMCAIVAIIIALNAPHLTRNYVFYNNILGPNAQLSVKNPTIYTLSGNIVANILSNIPTTIVGNEQVGKMYDRFIEFAHIDKKTFFPYGDITNRGKFTTHEDSAQNPFHTLIIVCIFLLFMIRKIKIPVFYSLLTLSSIITFCLLLTWQPWIVRLQVPIFAFCAPLFGIFVEQIRLKQLQNCLLALCCLSALPSLFLNVSRPLVPSGMIHSKPSIWQNAREELYFANKRALYKQYNGAIDVLVKEHPQKIGLVLGGDAWEYPFWVLLKKRVAIMPHIVHTPSQHEIEKQKPKYLFVHEATLPSEQNPISLFRIYKHDSSAYSQIF